MLYLKHLKDLGLLTKHDILVRIIGKYKQDQALQVMNKLRSEYDDVTHYKLEREIRLHTTEYSETHQDGPGSGIAQVIVKVLIILNMTFLLY